MFGLVILSICGDADEAGGEDDAEDLQERHSETESADQTELCCELCRQADSATRVLNVAGVVPLTAARARGLTASVGHRQPGVGGGPVGTDPVLRSWS